MAKVCSPAFTNASKVPERSKSCPCDGFCFSWTLLLFFNLSREENLYATSLENKCTRDLRHVRVIRVRHASWGRHSWRKNLRGVQNVGHVGRKTSTKLACDVVKIQCVYLFLSTVQWYVSFWYNETHSNCCLCLPVPGGHNPWSNRRGRPKKLG